MPHVCFLFLKKEWFEDIKDFGPVSLVRSLCKILAKVLVNILKKVIAKVVSRNHNALVEDKQVLDAILIANETSFEKKKL